MKRQRLIDLRDPREPLGLVSPSSLAYEIDDEPLWDRIEHLQAKLEDHVAKAAPPDVVADVRSQISALLEIDSRRWNEDLDDMQQLDRGALEGIVAAARRLLGEADEDPSAAH